MKIGVYGDSFANSPNCASMQYHWSTLLKEELDAEVDNYGQPGSSVYFTYKNFIENHDKYDLNIVVITEPGRYIKTIEVGYDKTVHIPSVNTIEDMCKLHTGYSPDRKTVQYLEGWFMCSDDSYNRDMSELMVDKIIERDSNVLLLPGFDNSLSSTQLEKMGISNFTLSDLVVKQFNLFKIYDPVPYLYGESKQLIAGHLIPTMNKLVFDAILNKINTGVWKCKDPNDIEIPHQLHEYWDISEYYRIRGEKL